MRLLIVEDSPGYAKLVEEMLRDVLGGAVEVVHRDALAGVGLAVREEPVDCVVLDLSLPDAGGLEALEAVQSMAPDVPVIVLTGTDDQALAVQAVHDGAQDYLLKRHADSHLLVRSVRYAIERKRSDARLAHQALHDALTTLPNRVLLLDRLNVAVARSQRRPTSLAVLFLDLDRFKTVNDSLGHDAGDELLVELAGRLRPVLRPGDTVARFGGDEFVILCEDLNEEREAVRVAKRAREAIAEPVELRGREISVQASVGIARGRAETSADGLLREADAAMYRAKRGGTGIAWFEANMHAEAVAELETEHELRQALERGELRVHYQPEIALDGRKHALGVEALVRWDHPRRGLLLPAEFIGVAEKTGLIVEIGEFVLSEACRRLAGWRRQRLVPAQFTVAVNLSLRQFGSPGLVDSVAAALAASQLPPGCLCLEVTESCVAWDTVRTATVLDDLKRLGVRLALDDFGTGYSSLSALSSYPLDMVKIDRSFIEGVDRDTATARMFAAILGVIRASELQAVAEGTEELRQIEFLLGLGCDAAQGFFFSRPAPAEAILPRLAAAADPTNGR